MLSLKGASTVVYDPQTSGSARATFPTLSDAESALAAREGVIDVLVATEWAELVDLDPAADTKVARGRLMLDGRNCMPVNRWHPSSRVHRTLGHAGSILEHSA